MGKETREALEAAGLTHREALVVDYVADKHGATVPEIRRGLGISQSQLWRTMEPLRGAWLVPVVVPLTGKRRSRTRRGAPAPLWALARPLHDLIREGAQARVEEIASACRAAGVPLR